jgi:DNA-binding MarR family transcriptional regulator
MPYPEYTALNLISRHPKGIRPSDISAALVIPAQTLTRILSGLQRDGYIDRKTNARDHRSSVITITEAGTEKMKPLQAKLTEIEERALFRFGIDELADQSRLSEKLLKSLEAAFQYHDGD